jgi:hypothetical protein
MVLLTRALEQRLISGVLNQGMLKDVHRLRRQPSLVEHLGPYQLL